MARPTFLQKVLRRPSQKYATGTSRTTSTKALQPQEQPHTRDFHSTKGELLRIASELNHEDPLEESNHESRHGLQDKSCSFIQNGQVVLTAATALDSGGHVPSVSIATGVHGEKPQVPRQETVWEFHACDADQSIDPAQHDSEEVFYTPPTTPISSLPASCSQTPVHSPYSTPLHSAASSVASIGSDNPQAISVSTTSLTKSSLTTTVTVKNEPGHHKRNSTHRHLTYTDQDWAKDVRWLEASQYNGPRGKNTRHNTSPNSVSNAASRSASSLPSTVSSHTSRTYTTHVPSQMHDLPKVEPPFPHGRRSKGHGHMKAKVMRAMVGMSVLLEVEEDAYLCGDPAGADKSMSHKRSQSLTYIPTHTLQPPRPVRQEPPAASSRSAPRLTRRRSSSYPSLSRDGTPSRSPSTRLHSRATGVTSHYGVSGASASSVSVASRPMSSASRATSSTTKSPYTLAPFNALDALAAHASSSREANALPSSGTRGFTSLVLPHAATSSATSGSNSGIGSWRPWKKGRRATAAESLGAGLGFGDKIDLTRAGLAQTTMASVEIVRGIASGHVECQESKPSGPSFGLGWFSKDDNKQGKGKSRQVPADSPLGFTVYRKPPVYVGGSSVLVQIWAVGLDDVDARLVGVHPPPWKQPSPGTPHRAEEKSEGKRPVPLGYIPGRSFVGRILEVGWDVDNHSLKRGEWVIGLNSVHKCGVLTEFIIVDRHRIHCVPHPHMPDQPLLVLASLSEDDKIAQRNSLVFPAVNEPKGLTVDELALLPLSGVPAYRAVRTLAHITRALVKPDVAVRRLRGNEHSPEATMDTNEDDVVMMRSIKYGSAEKRLDTMRPRILILRGHDGPGALALQMLVRAGWSVWAHVPVPFDLPGLPHESEEDLQNEEKKRTLAIRRVMLERIEKRLRGWGADEVLFVPIETSSALQPTPRDNPFSSSPSLHYPQSSSCSAHSQNISPSPFSRSSTSSTISSPYSSSAHGHISSTSHSCCALPTPYSYTGLPLTSYQTEKTSATALFTYLARGRVRFDAVIDTIGGREIWEAGRALLSLPVHDAARASIEGQFTTLVGDAPDRVVSTASDHFRAGVRALRIGNAKSSLQVHDDAESSPASVGLARGKRDRKMKPRPVNYAWVNVMSDVDWEGGDVRDSLSAVLEMAVEEDVRPAVGLSDFPDLSKKGKERMKNKFGGGDGETLGKVIPFENTPQVFTVGGGLEHGGTVVSRIAG